MKPLIKWPGGKSSEIKQFEYMLPQYERYIEPFLGGGALFFHLNPQSAVIGDVSEPLMDMYRLIQENDQDFHRLLDLYSRAFATLQEKCDKHYGSLHTLYQIYELTAKEGLDVGKLHLAETLVRQIEGDCQYLPELVPDMERFHEVMRASVEDKLIRTAANNRKKAFSEKDLKANLITGFTSGFYLYFREIYNALAADKMDATRQYRIANFYFIREFCYGAMFRYNASGEFNVPYGGASYNKKDLAGKIEAMFAPETVKLLKRTQICCGDFSEVMNSLDLTEQDFLFLDPPYDTTFSEYEGHTFDADDQWRLKEFLKETKAQFLLVIKNTEYIRKLYEGLFRIVSFENHYTYNVRSRNDRATEHLLITNIPEDQMPWLQENV